MPDSNSPKSNGDGTPQQPPTVPYISKIDERGKLAVWLVDGAYIRGRM